MQTLAFSELGSGVHLSFSERRRRRGSPGIQTAAHQGQYPLGCDSEGVEEQKWLSVMCVLLFLVPAPELGVASRWSVLANPPLQRLVSVVGSSWSVSH